MPLGSSISIQDLSVAIDVPKPLLARVVRYAIANGLFQEEPTNVIRHSASSAALVRNPHLANIVHFGTEFLGNSLMKVPDAVLLKRDDPAHAVHAAFNIAYRTDETLFEYLHKNEDLTRKYHEYLAGRVNTPLWSVDRLRAAWPWTSKGKVTVVDVSFQSAGNIYRLVVLS